MITLETITLETIQKLDTLVSQIPTQKSNLDVLNKSNEVATILQLKPLVVV